MTKPVTPQDIFDMWQKMVNPGGYPLQSLMFPVLDAREIDKKIAELEAVEHWLKTNVNMLQLTIKSLQYQRAMLKGGEKFQQEIAQGAEASDASEQPANPALWAWNLMAQGGKAAKGTAKAQPQEKAAPKAKSRKKPPSAGA